MKNPLHHNDDPQKQEMIKRRRFSTRINLFFFCTFILFSVLIVRLALLQFVEGKALAERKEEKTQRDVKIPPIRGNIYDASGEYAIAYTSSTQSLFFRMEPGQDKAKVVALADRLAQIFAEHGRKDRKQPTAAEIVEAMNVGYDHELNDTRSKRAIMYNFVPRRIKADLTPKEIAYFMEHRDEEQFKWLDVTEESIRTYSPDTVAVQLVGYMKPYSVVRGLENIQPKYKDPEYTKNYLDTEEVGFDGLEYMYQNELRGETGAKSYPVNAADKIVGKMTLIKPEKGNNLKLSIHKDIQLATEEKIKQHLDWLKTDEARRVSGGFANAPYARTGFAVAIEVKTGRVVTMASFPDYNPNDWQERPMPTEKWNEIQRFIYNGTIRTATPPGWDEKQLTRHPGSIVYMGSTIKPLSVLIGLNEGLFGINETYYDKGYMEFGSVGHEVRIWNSQNQANGAINGARAIAVSSNTFMSEMVGMRLNAKYPGEKGVLVWEDYLKKFGLGVLTGSDLIGESAGVNEFKVLAKKESNVSALVRGSWGQNEKYTTLQLAQYAATLANKGKRMKPLFVDEITTYDGQLIKKIEPEMLEETKFPAQYWDTIFKGMKDVRKQGFDDFPYTIATKTGTSTQAVPPLKAGDPALIDNAVFIAFAPIEDPKLAVAVVVPEGGYGSWGAAPIARTLFDGYDKYYGLGSAPNPNIKLPHEPK